MPSQRASVIHLMFRSLTCASKLSIGLVPLSRRSAPAHAGKVRECVSALVRQCASALALSRYSLFPIPYSLFPIPYSLFPVPCPSVPALAAVQHLVRRQRQERLELAAQHQLVQQLARL